MGAYWVLNPAPGGACVFGLHLAAFGFPSEVAIRGGRGTRASGAVPPNPGAQTAAPLPPRITTSAGARESPENTGPTRHLDGGDGGDGGPIVRAWCRGVKALRRYKTLYRQDGAMKTTLDLDENLLAEAKALAIRERTTLTRLVEEGLQLRLRQHELPSEPGRLPVHHGQGGLTAGLDGLSNKALMNAVDEA